jgi:hypothetical protein
VKTNQHRAWIRLTISAWSSAILSLVFTVSVHAASSVVQNGDFETGTFSSWTQSGNTGFTSVTSGNSSYTHSGTYGASVGPSGSLGFLSQTLTTVPGQIYRLSFWLNSPGGSPSEFNATWNGSTLIDLVNPPATGWSNYVFTVTATSSSTVLQFGLRNDPDFFGLDDISVTPVGVGITFDTLGNFMAVPNGYSGLNWNSFNTFDVGDSGPMTNGYAVGMVSTNNVAFNANLSGPSSITNANPFNLFSAYLTAAWNDNLQVEVKGYTGGVLVYDNTYTLSATSRTLINFNYLGVTEVDFIASGGTVHSGYNGSGTYFVMDNVNAATGPGVQSNPQITVPLPGPSLGQSAYVRSTLGEPWGRVDNDTAMNHVFGTNVWHDLRYETVDPATLFSPAMHCIFLEGSDNNALALATFLAANLSAMQTWVSNGGSLFINAAPNEGGNINFGFGVTLNYSEEQFAASGSAVNPLNPIFNGPFAPVGTHWTGNSFAHATNSGAGLIPLIINTNNGSILLGELSPGLGHALFGGMTVDSFHSPQPQAANLRANILAYANNCPQGTFDDLTPTLSGLPVPNGYHGLIWNSFIYFNAANYSGNPSGYGAGVVSSNNAAFNRVGAPANVTNSTPFNFISAELTAAWNDNLQVEAQGYVHGVLAYDQTYTLSATMPTLIIFDYLGVTEVNFISSGGTVHPGYTGGGTHFVMDNVTVAAAPAPLLTVFHTTTNTVVVSWSSPSIGWNLQQNTDLNTTIWTSPLENVNDDGTNKFIIVNPPAGNRFYRLTLP